MASATDAYESAVRADAPWGYWRLDDPNLVPDSSGNGKTLRPSGSGISSEAGRLNLARRFTGQGWLERASLTATGDAPAARGFSAEMWLRTGPNQTSSGRAGLFLLGEYIGTGVEWWLNRVGQPSPGNLWFWYDRDWSGSRTAGPRVDDGYWHHVVLTRDIANSVVRVYIDGSLVGSLATSAFQDPLSVYSGGDLAFGNLGGATGVDVYLDELALYTHTLSATRVAAHYSAADGAPPAVELSGALYERRNQPNDHRSEGLYDASYGLHVEATDGDSQNPGAGVASIEIKVDGVRKDYVLQPCLTSNCTMSRDFTLLSDQYADGEHTIVVTVVDQAGKVTSREWQVTIDRRGDIYVAREHGDDPALGGELLATEWARFASAEARREDISRVATRQPIPCSEDDPARCEEVRVRHLSPFDDSLSADDNYTVTRGPEGDPHLDVVADISRPSPEGDPVSRGPLRDALQPWQQPPPVWGPEYELYERSVTEDFDGEQITLVVRAWVDARTKMPLRATETTSDGEELGAVYWSYGRGRLEDHEVPSDHFGIARPVEPSSEEEVEYKSEGPIPSLFDRETGARFIPMYLGRAPTIGLRAYCLATTETLYRTETEPAPPAGGEGAAEPDPSGPVTTALASYNEVAAGTACIPGVGSLDEPALTVSAYARTSTVGAAWSSTYHAAVEEWSGNPLMDDALQAGTQPVMLQGQARTAYVVPYSSSELAVLVETDDTVYTVKGSFTRADIASIFAAMTPISQNQGGS